MKSDQEDSTSFNKDIKRKKTHYILILSVIALLLLIALMIYNETFNEKKLNDIDLKIKEYGKALDKIQQSEDEKNLANASLLYYLLFKNENYLQQYDSLTYELQSGLKNVLISNGAALGVITADTLNLSKLNNFVGVESAPLAKPNLTNEYNDFKNKIMDQVLLGTTFESKTEIDSVEKKGLFKRISGAVKGDVDVQKQITDSKLVLKYGNTVEEVTIDGLLRNTVDRALEQYKEKVKGLAENAKDIYLKNNNLLKNNDSINKYTNLLITDFKLSISKLNAAAKEQYQKQYGTNKKIRFIGVYALLAIVLALVIYLLYITRLTYKYEKQLQEAKDDLQENLKFKNKLVSMISHEVRSPLGIIGLMTKQILKLEKDPVKTEMFESVNYTTNNILLLSNQILDFSKGENKRLEIVNDDFNLKTEVDKILSSFIPLVETKGNVLEIKNDIDGNLNVITDKTKLHQLFYNIIGNANKYTEKGKIAVTCQLLKNENNKPSLNINITDTGLGMSPEDLELALNPYHQGQNKVMGYQNMGVGLGLYLCKEIVDLLDGTIKISSALKKGTNISIAYPINIK